MSKKFKDFIYAGKRLSNLRQKYISANFENADEIALSMERNMEVGETNPYKIEGNYFGDIWADTLPLTINLIKNPCFYHTQSERMITKEDIREISRWLTSNHYPEWLEFEYDSNDNSDAKFYRGWFSNIEPFVVGGNIYGLIISFKCTTPFAYTDELSKQITPSGSYSEYTITNDSDELYSCCYPTIQIHPKANGYVAICNLSDSSVLKEGTLTVSENHFDSMLEICETYAKSKGCDIRYTGTGTFNVVPICDNTAIQFYLVDKYNAHEQKCTAYYDPITKYYKIIEDGFLFLKVSTNLDIQIDCKRLTITDALGRMVTYDKLGISDVDHMYWLRYINGENNLVLYGNADFTFTHRESRKVGER